MALLELIAAPAAITRKLAPTVSAEQQPAHRLATLVASGQTAPLRHFRTLLGSRLGERVTRIVNCPWCLAPWAAAALAMLGSISPRWYIAAAVALTRRPGDPVACRCG
jgi:hypothetical protein